MFVRIYLHTQSSKANITIRSTNATIKCCNGNSIFGNSWGKTKNSQTAQCGQSVMNVSLLLQILVNFMRKTYLLLLGNKLQSPSHVLAPKGTQMRYHPHSTYHGVCLAYFSCWKLIVKSPNLQNSNYLRRRNWRKHYSSQKIWKKKSRGTW